MKIEKRQTFFIVLLSLLLTIGVTFGILMLAPVQEAHAESSISYSSQHTAMGDIDWVSNLPYGAGGTGHTSYSSGSYSQYFAVRFLGYSNSTTENIYSGKVFNRGGITINAVLFKTTNPHNGNWPFNHISSILRNNTTGLLISSRSFSGAGTVTLYSGNLSDGNYTLTYVAGGTRSGIASGTITDTFTFSFTIDQTAPNVRLTAGGANISSGAYTNDLISFSASDTRFRYIYYKRPESSTFQPVSSTSYSVSASESNNGRWYFYAGDSAGNNTATYSVYLDTVKPTGIMTATIGGTLSNGAYSKYQVKYYASDKGGVSRCEYKTPSSSSWLSYTPNVAVGSTTGTYSFRAYDNAGNISNESNFFYDSVSPSGGVYRDNTLVSSGAKVQAGFIKYIASDNSSGIASCYVKEPGQTTYKAYISGTPYTKEGTYYFYSVDRASNQSSTVSITLDNTPPRCTLYGGTSEAPNGSYVKEAYVKFNATDAISGITGAYVQKPGTTQYVSYTLNTQLTVEGKYSFYSLDYANNRSATYTVTLDRTKPVGSLKTENGTIASGTITNARTIGYTATDSISGIGSYYVKKPGASVFTIYTQDMELTDDGNYEFYAVDRSGNQSDISPLQWDKLTPEGVLYAGSSQVESGTITNASYIRFVATDSMAGVARRFVKMPGDNDFIPYNDGTQLSVEGEYRFYAEDKANNRSLEYVITIDRTKPTGVLYGGTSTVANGSFTNADYVTYQATDNLNVKTLYVKTPGASVFKTFATGTTFAAEGCYEFYSEDYGGNLSDTVSVTLDKTKPVNSLYSESKIVQSGTKTNAKYIKLTATDALSGVSKIYVKAPNAAEFTEYVSGTQLTAEGRYEFYTVDRSSNRTDTINVILDRTQPTGQLFAGTAKIDNGGYTTASYIKFSAIDELSGVIGMFVKMPDDSDFITYSEGTILSAEGVYKFYATDGSNNRTDDYTITIDRIKPSGTLYAGTQAVKSGTVTNAEYVTFAGSDNIALGNIFVKKPSAKAFEVFSKGEQFKVEGEYSFFAEDRAGNRSETVTITLDRTKPIGRISATGEYANKPISYTATDERSGIARCEYRVGSGAWNEYVSGATIPVTGQNGLYTFRAIDVANNVSEEVSVYFDTTNPFAKLYAGSVETENGSFTNAENIHFIATDATLDECYILTPGAKQYVIYKNGSLYAVAGKYEFYAVDRAGNRSETYKLTIDRITPSGQLYSDESKIANGSYTAASYVQFAANDESGISGLFVRTPNNASFAAYTEGTMLTVEGEYVFYALDNAGNRSDDFTVTIDRTVPTSILYAGTSAMASGTITNASYVTFSANDNFALNGLFVKKPNARDFEVFIAGTHFTVEGLYEFYGEDRAGNRTATLAITLDVSKPNGQIFAGDTAIENNAYTHAESVSFTATDNVSGVKRIIVKLPSNVDFTEYVSGRKISENGLIQFRIEDNAGNLSELYSVNLDTERPNGQIVGANGEIPSGAILNGEYIQFISTDEISGVSNVYLKLPGKAVFEIYTAGTKITAEGKTIFYVTDKAGNKSPDYSVTLDRTKPIGELTENSGHTNKSFAYTATDDSTGIAYCEYKTPDGEWTEYAAGTTIPKTSTNGLYQFRAVDVAGNISEIITVFLDTVNPTGKLYANDTEKSSGSYTNFDRISFVAEDTNLTTCFVLTPNATEWKTYTSGALYSDSGKYEFYCVDKAGNRSETHRIIIDRTEKALTLNNVSNGRTDKNVSIAWANGDPDISAPVVSVTVNGELYSNGSALNTIMGGRYTVVSIDAAGNVWKFEFVSERVNIKTVTTNKEWWEAKDAGGKYYAFESYENALDYAMARERTLIRYGEWTNAEAWDTGVMMDTTDSVNAKPGRFFIYKKSGDPNAEVAYFTEERLNAVIREYAEDGIKHCYYWNGSPLVSADGNDLYNLNTQGVFLADKIELTDKAHFYINGVLFEGTVYDVPGRHEVVVKDDYGNEKTYSFIIVRDLPNLLLAVGESEYIEADLAQVYYLKNTAKLKITDTTDEYAMFYIKDANGEIIATLSLGDEYTISTSGKFFIQAVNHYGLTEELQIYISLDAPTITFNENTTKKQMILTVKPSKDEYAKLQNITIYKSVDSGKTWVMLTVDDYGTKITTAYLTYKFRTSGKYRVVVEDTFHTGFEAVELTEVFRQTAPVGTLNNVENGGYTNKNVTFVWTDEATATVIMNGTTSEYTSGAVLTDEGEYEIELKNYDGQMFKVKFTIDKTLPDYELTGVTAGETTNTDSSAKWTDTEVTATITRNGITGDYLSGTVLTEDGLYKLTFTDKAGNVSEVTFTIDKTVDFTLNALDGFITNDDVMLKANEALMVTLKKDGESVPYKLGDVIKNEGVYEVIVTDSFGNVKTVTFRIFKKAVVNSFEFEYSGAAATLNGEPCEELKFDKDGTYLVSVENDGKTYSFTVKLDRTAPTLTIVGVKDGGETKSNVTLKDVSEEATIEVYLNDEKLNYAIGTSLSELGAYKVVVTDAAGNVTEYTFSILFSLNGGAVALIFIGIFAMIGIILGAIFGKKAVYKKKLKAKADAEKAANEASENAEAPIENGESESENAADFDETATEDAEEYEDEEEI